MRIEEEGRKVEISYEDFPETDNYVKTLPCYVSMIFS